MIMNHAKKNMKLSATFIFLTKYFSIVVWVVLATFAAALKLYVHFWTIY